MTNQRTNPWRPFEDVKMEELSNLGWTAESIGQALGRSRNSVISRSHRIGVTIGAVRKTTNSTNLRKKVAVMKVKKITEPRPPAIKAAPLKEADVVQFSDYKLLRVDHVGANDCRYPVQRDGEGEWLLCCRPKGHAVYCKEHHDACYVPPRPRTREEMLRRRYR